ncbi:MAG: hypothetical protein V4615_12895 [Bacteroidota bacterium]
MKNKTLLLPLLFCCQILFGQKEVSNLHYTWTEHFISPKKTDVKEKYQFNFNWNPETQIFVKDKKESGDSKRIFPRYIIDNKRRIIVVQRDKRNEYVLEELDSFFLPQKLKLEPAVETKTINGFKCHSYTTTATVTMGSAKVQEEYTLWVTDELKFNDDLNSTVFAFFRPQSVSHQGTNDFKGVLVQLDYKTTYGKSTWTNIIALDPSKFDEKAEPIQWPWEMKDGVAWLEILATVPGTIMIIPGWESQSAGGGNTRINNAGVYRTGDGSIASMNKRLKALLVEITGQEKPKTKPQFFMNGIPPGFNPE